MCQIAAVGSAERFKLLGTPCFDRDAPARGSMDDDELDRQIAPRKQAIKALITELDRLGAAPAGGITEDDETFLLDAARQIRALLAEGEVSFALRLRIVELLDVQVALQMIDGEKRISVHATLTGTQKDMSLVSATSICPGHKQHTVITLRATLPLAA